MTIASVKYKMIIGLLSAFSFVSCFKGVESPGKTAKDFGLNLSVSDLSEKYAVIVNDTLKIAPIVKDKDGAPIDTSMYDAIWILRSSNSFYNSSGRPIDTLRGFNLHYPATLQYSGDYLWEYKITNKSNGLFYSKAFSVNTFMPTLDCFYFLSQTAVGESRLSGVYYDRSISDYDTITDMIGYMQNTVLKSPTLYRLKGNPLFLSNGFTSALGEISMGYFLSVATDESATLLNANFLAPRRKLEDITDSAFFDFKFLMSEEDPDSYASTKILAFEENSQEPLLLNYDHKLYISDYSDVFEKASIYIPGTDDTELKLSKWLFYSNDPYESHRVVFDENTQRFFMLSVESSHVDVNTFTIPYSDKKKLLFGTYSEYSGGRGYAVMQNNDNDSTFLLVFDLNAKLYAYKPLRENGITENTQFAVSNTYGHLFYNVGSKVYEYDVNKGTSIEMLDFGNREISYMSAIKSPVFATEEVNSRFKALSETIVVSSYDKGNLKNSGTVDFYKVPAANQKIYSIASFSGFGRVVSMVYMNI